MLLLKPVPELRLLLCSSQSLVLHTSSTDAATGLYMCVCPIPTPSLSSAIFLSLLTFTTTQLLLSPNMNVYLVTSQDTFIHPLHHILEAVRVGKHFIEEDHSKPAKTVW